MRLHKGSNQYKDRYQYPLGLRAIDWIRILIVVILTMGGSIIAATHQPDVLSPLGSQIYAFSEPTPTPSPSPAPTVENIVAYIAKVFKPEGKAVVVRAINCFYSESGLRADAYNHNTNGTEDRGVAQINSIWKMTPENAHNFQKNIDMAYKIYLRSDHTFNPWYGKGCR